MSIKSLLGGSVLGNATVLDSKKIPTKFGAIADRYNQLKTVQWGGKEEDRNLDYMSKLVKTED